jgi:hypothetical protein
MEGIRIHHGNLWFAGENQNWPLAEYEESLVRSGFKRIKKYHGESTEGRAARMIEPAMDNLSVAIQQKPQQSLKTVMSCSPAPAIIVIKQLITHSISLPNPLHRHLAISSLK